MIKKLLILITIVGLVYACESNINSPEQSSDDVVLNEGDVPPCANPNGCP